jgi:predicted nucleic acid-binding protein
MSYLADTNILLRSIQNTDPMRDLAAGAIETLLNRGETVCVFPQNLIELWAVATRPVANNGLGLSGDAAALELAKTKKILALRLDLPAIFPEWERLIAQHKVMGKQAHDTRIVAAMNVHGITNLLTFNTGDFKRFTHINVFHPSDTK